MEPESILSERLSKAERQLRLLTNEINDIKGKMLQLQRASNSR